MLWQVRASLQDRPGALAALAASCGDQLVNILGLQIFPGPDGRVVDELVLHTPGGWSRPDVEQLCVLAGVDDPVVVAGSPHALEDQPVRYMRAAQVVMERPELLTEQLCRLLDASPADGLPGLPELVLDDPFGPAVALSRMVPFTDTELARASELRRLAAVALGVTGDPAVVRQGADGEAATAEQPDAAGPPVLRRGTTRDVPAVVAMHERCSRETLFRRYHAPMPRVTPRLARSMLEPDQGLSMVLTVGDDVVALGVVALGPGGPEAGLLVEDRWQRKGLGSRLLRALAEEAADRRLTVLTCQVQPDNDAVLRTIRRARLRARVNRVDGLTVYRIPVARLEDPDGRPRRGRPAMDELTPPLVALLHDRRELREIYPAADLIDQAVRGGA
ncbi:MAG TPA: GNAT family N-acetyltransferase [Nocardioidaceae bacterium]